MKKFNMTAIPMNHRRALKRASLWRRLMPNSEPPLMGDLIRFGELAGSHLNDIIERLAKSDYVEGASDEMLHARCGELAGIVAISKSRKNRQK
jgi:hypothetical protein